jgi:hypothetical protein
MDVVPTLHLLSSELGQQAYNAAPVDLADVEYAHDQQS